MQDEIDDQTAVDLVKSESDLIKGCAKLRDYAFCHGSEDNISVIVVRFK